MNRVGEQAGEAVKRGRVDSADRFGGRFDRRKGGGMPPRGGGTKGHGRLTNGEFRIEFSATHPPRLSGFVREAHLWRVFYAPLFGRGVR